MTKRYCVNPACLIDACSLAGSENEVYVVPILSRNTHNVLDLFQGMRSLALVIEGKAFV